jgi:hypothetical protein
MRRPVVLLLVPLALVLFLAWRMVSSTPPSRSLEVPASGPGAEAHRPRDPVVAAPAEREEVALPAAAPPPAPRPGESIEDRTPKASDDPAWGAHYAGWSTARLEARLNEIEPRYLAEVDRLCEERFSAGRYRVIPASEMEGEDSAYDVLASYDEQGVLTRTRAVPTPSFDPAHPVDAETGMEYQVVSLVPEYYPELYRQRGEVEWLRGTLAERFDKEKDPP